MSKEILIELGLFIKLVILEIEISFLLQKNQLNEYFRKKQTKQAKD